MSEYRPWASSRAARAVMQGNRSRDTKPELAVRRLQHAAGFRYRVSIRPEPTLRRTADIVFPRQQVAVFIDGCFWHGCPDHPKSSPSTNANYWSKKLRRNAERDLETTHLLQDAGWRVLRFWEHEDPHQVAEQIGVTVMSN